MEEIKPMKTTFYGDVVIYHVAENADLEVRVADDTVWLLQSQMAMLFGVKENTVTYHIKEIYKIRELEVEATARKIRVVRKEGNRMVNRYIDFYNLDMILSIGYRVNTVSGIQFRHWASGVLKDIKLVDNYIDDSVLLLLGKRQSEVSATIYTECITNQIQTDLSKYNTQYPPIAIQEMGKVHDRFLIIDRQLYHFGASFKDLGKRLFVVSKIEEPAVTDALMKVFS